MTFGQRLRVLRKRVKKTQKKIEADTGIPQTTLSDWERDRSEPSLSEAVKLADAVGVTLIELAYGCFDETCASIEKAG